MPSLLYDIIRVLLAMAPAAAFGCLLLAGISLRKEGGTVFWVGGGFSRQMISAVIFLVVKPTLTWFQDRKNSMVAYESMGARDTDAPAAGQQFRERRVESSQTPPSKPAPGRNSPGPEPLSTKTP